MNPSVGRGPTMFNLHLSQRNYRSRRQSLPCPSPSMGPVLHSQLRPQRKSSPPSKPSLHLLCLPSMGRPILGREVSTPRGTIMGRASVDVSPHVTTQCWSRMRRLTLRPNGSTRASVSPHRCLCTGDCTLTPSPADKAAAFMRPLATLRERARHLQLSNASRESWSVWSAIRRLRFPLQQRHPRSSTRFLARIGFTLFIKSELFEITCFSCPFFHGQRISSLSPHLWKVFGWPPARWWPARFGSGLG
jgi:hypothetical protein